MEDSESEGNAYFRHLYEQALTDKVWTIKAHEHTAQVPMGIREERERSFRSGDLPLLYCSPTMELASHKRPQYRVNAKRPSNPRKLRSAVCGPAVLDSQH